MNHRLTPEQHEAVLGFMSREHLRVVAYAGAGKTSTLTAMAKSQPHRRGLYVAFNKAIATDAERKFPISVNCRTAHSLAYRTVKQLGYADEKLRTGINGRNLRDNGIGIECVAGVSPDVARQLIIGTLRRFCQSAHTDVQAVHVPRPRKPLDPDDWRDQRRATVQSTQQLWNRMIDVGSTTALGHDGYLKLWQLCRPTLQADVIFLDEAQDLNPVLVDVVKRQADAGVQLISVGDSHQQIYAWRGAIDALEELPGRVTRLTQSFRFGSSIACFANDLLRAMGETVPLRGNGREDDEVGPSDGLASAILCRTNSGVVTNAAQLIDVGCQVYVPGGVNELLSLVEDAERLQQHHAARTVDLLGFNTWREVVEYAESDEGQDLKVFVNLVEKHGTRDLRNILGQVMQVETPETTAVSTAHKAKGLEWESVELWDDFAISGREVSTEERRLFYVAATRAKHQLMVADELAAVYTR